ncbi:MAG: arylsulfatase [Bryobacteraceae bacterium]
MTRRQLLSAAAAPSLLAPSLLGQRAARPNVILLITDDQGYGDLSIHGNPHLKTPNLDSIGRDGIQFTQFQVCPVCSPTRSSLMTGRYNYRTGVVDTFLGRSLMYPDEVTLAEMLRDASYRTGIFGKWHLGDNYPLRSIDQGFEESLVCKGGGLTQPSDPPGNTYFDPILQYNGKSEKRTGYCTDIFFNAALEFVQQNRSRPFFAYIAPNAPHDPLQVDEALVKPFRALGLDEQTAKTYAMVKNIDDNVGRLLARLKTLGLDDNTIVIYMTDNGPQRPRFNAGMRAQKGTVYQGGIRVPFFLRWPARIKAGRTIDRIAAHIDVTPTLLEVCGVAPPPGVRFDGINILRGDTDWPDRTLYTQWHRGDEPVAFRACAARTQRWKLIDGKELYDLAADPAEQHDLAAANPDVVRRMREGYQAWFRDVSSTRGYAPPRIKIGTRFEDPVTLTRQDWRGPEAAWTPEAVGHWEVDLAQTPSYQITLRTYPAPDACLARLRWNGAPFEQPVAKGAESCRFSVKLAPGAGRIEAFLDLGARRHGVRYLDVKRVG